MMITKPFVLIIALSAVSALRHYHLKNQYKWDEYIQICSLALSDLLKVICPENFNDHRSSSPSPDINPLSLNENGTLSADCCERQCTPRYILNYYCQYRESADTGKDLIIRTTIKPPTTVGPILKVPIGSNAQTKYCYKQYIKEQGIIILWECRRDDKIADQKITTVPNMKKIE